MTDDQWRRRRDEEEDFGPPLFSEDALESTARVERDRTVEFGNRRGRLAGC